jgi:hypothetical protein
MCFLVVSSFSRRKYVVFSLNKAGKKLVRRFSILKNKFFGGKRSRDWYGHKKPHTPPLSIRSLTTRVLTRFVSRDVTRFVSRDVTRFVSRVVTRFVSRECCSCAAILKVAISSRKRLFIYHVEFCFKFHRICDVKRLVAWEKKEGYSTKLLRKKEGFCCLFQWVLGPSLKPVYKMQTTAFKFVVFSTLNIWK